MKMVIEQDEEEYSRVALLMERNRLSRRSFMSGSDE